MRTCKWTSSEGPTLGVAACSSLLLGAVALGAVLSGCGAVDDRETTVSSEADAPFSPPAGVTPGVSGVSGAPGMSGTPGSVGASGSVGSPTASGAAGAPGASTPGASNSAGAPGAADMLGGDEGELPANDYCVVGQSLLGACRLGPG